MKMKLLLKTERDNRWKGNFKFLIDKNKIGKVGIYVTRSETSRVNSVTVTICILCKKFVEDNTKPKAISYFTEELWNKSINYY
jgi:hypothetical protein